MNDTTDNMESNQNADKSDSIAEQSTDAALVDNVTPNKPDHSNARATVVVDGLSVLGFNQNTNQAEIRFFKNMHRAVEMKIYETRDGQCNLFWSTEKDFPYSTFGMEISINASNKDKPCSRYENGPEDSMDAEDYRNMPNLAKWHGVPNLQSIPDKQNNHISARAYVHNAVFYTYKMSARDATRYVVSHSGRPTEVTALKKIGRIVGGDIFLNNDTENLEIEIKALNVRDPFKVPPLAASGKPYTIIIRVDSIDEEHSHLALLYNVLRRPPGDMRTFALSYDGIEPPFLFCDEVGVKSTQYECQTFNCGVYC